MITPVSDGRSDPVNWLNTPCIMKGVGERGDVFVVVLCVAVGAGPDGVVNACNYLQ